MTNRFISTFCAVMRHTGMRRKPYFPSYIASLTYFGTWRSNGAGSPSDNSQIIFVQHPEIKIVAPEVVTKLGSLHSASTWPPFRRVLVPSRRNCTRPPSQTSGPLKFSFSWPEDWLAPGHPARPNGTPLHSAQVAAPFRQPTFVTPGIDWCDQSGVGFSAKHAPNPTPLPSHTGFSAFRLWVHFAHGNNGQNRPVPLIRSSVPFGFGCISHSRIPNPDGQLESLSSVPFGFGCISHS